MEEYANPEDFEEKKPFNLKGKIENFLKSPYFVICIIILVAISTFALGKYSNIKSQREPVKILNVSDQLNLNSNQDQSATVIESNIQPTPNIQTPVSSGEVVASKNSTKYHLPNCPGAKQIAAKNLITFSSAESARSAGYTPALNCKGLK